jgi:hypothetical protein
MTNDETKIVNSESPSESKGTVSSLDFRDSSFRHWNLIIRIFRGPAVIAFFLALTWCAHFSRSSRMGFYEDDHSFAVEAMTSTPGDLLRWTWDQIRYFPMPQGRPIGFVLGRVLPWMGYKAGGIPGMYVVGWLILSLNAVLFYNLLRRCLAAPLPLIGGIAFVFFPADTTRPFLCHAHILQPSVTFMLLASHFYLCDSWRWRAIAYLLAVCSLLTYETALLPFVMLPLLQRKWDLRWARSFAIHLAVLALLAGSLAGVRKIFGESRVVDANENFRTILSEIHDGTRIGIDTTLKMCRVRADQGADDFLADRQRNIRRNMLLVAMILGGSIFASTMLARDRRSTGGFALDLARATAFGVAALSISYVFCFTHYPPDFEIGRMTSTHLAATFPVAVLMAVVAGGSMLIPPRSTGALFSAVIVAVYFSCLYGSAIDEQDGFIHVWKARQQFWTQVMQLCPDMTDRTLIVCDGGARQAEYYMESSSWSDFMVLFQSYKFPARFSRPPMCFCFRPDANGPTWKRDAVLSKDGKITWRPNPFGHEPVETADDGNLILLHADDAGHVTRDLGAIVLAGKTIHLRADQSSATRCPFPTLPLYRILTERNDSVISGK